METPVARKGFIRRLMSWRSVLLLLAVFIALVELLLAEENWRGARDWRNYKLEMEAKGEHFDAARLIPPPVPDDQNFAMTPYFAPCFDLPPEILRQPIKYFTNMVNGYPVQGTTGLVMRGTNIPPALPNPMLRDHRFASSWYYGSAADLIGWAAAFQGSNSVIPPRKITDSVEAASIVLENLKPCEPTLAELLSASERPYCRFNIPYENWNNPQVASAVLEHLDLIHHLYQTLTLHAEAEMVAGRTDQALADINVLFRIDDGLKDEPLLMSQWLRLSDTAIALQPVGEGLAEHRWSDAQLQVLQERLQKTDLIASIVQAMHGERDIAANSRFDQGEMLPSGWNRLEQLNVNRAFDDMVFPRIDLAAREINPSVNHLIDLVCKKFTDVTGFRAVYIQHSIFANMLLAAYSRVPQKTAFAQNEVDLAMLACALERYRLAEGHYPEQLDDLLPRYVTVLPHDIINGQPLKYRRTDNGRFILYSIGWNEKDNGGVIAVDKEKHQDVLQGDWVWQYPEETELFALTGPLGRA